jgi:hypothetical protein
MKKQETEHDNQCQGEECPTGKRNRFFRGKVMRAAEFEAEQSYLLKRRRVINRSVHGWGVVSGFRMPPESGDAHVGAGLAFDRHGRELLLCEPVKIDERNAFVVDADEPCDTHPLRQASAGVYLLRAHYAERGIGDAPREPDCGCDPPEKNFICETVVFSLMALKDPERCPCEEGPCERQCACGGDCCCAGRGPHACLCEWVAKGDVKCASRLPCRWRGYQIDLCDGVPLACLTLVETKDPCNPIGIGEVKDACSPRRLVKNNDLLYDLIRGCDLTRIEKISWGKWHRAKQPMSFEDFKLKLGKVVEEKVLENGLEKNLEYALGDFKIYFSAPVLNETVLPDCFSFRITVPHTDTGWFDRRVIPVVKVVLAPPGPQDPANTTREVTLGLHVEFHGEVSGRANEFEQKDLDGVETLLAEIEVYGDFILDCHHQPVDANARGFALRELDGKPPMPSGNGTPGGSFLSAFQIAKYIKAGKGYQRTQP